MGFFSKIFKFKKYVERNEIGVKNYRIDKIGELEEMKYYDRLPPSSTITTIGSHPSYYFNSRYEHMGIIGIEVKILSKSISKRIPMPNTDFTSGIMPYDIMSAFQNQVNDVTLMAKNELTRALGIAENDVCNYIVKHNIINDYGSYQSLLEIIITAFYYGTEYKMPEKKTIRVQEEIDV